MAEIHKKIFDEIDSKTYKKWFPKYLLEKSTLELQIRNLKVKSNEFIDQIDAAIPRLGKSSENVY